MKRSWLIAVLLLSLLPAAALGDPVLDFNIVPSASAVIQYSGGATDPLTGEDLTVGTITGMLTPLHNYVAMSCIGCEVNFTTGGFTGMNGSDYTFAGGGSITVTGSVPDLNLGAGTVLLSGSFTGAKVTQWAGSTFNVIVSGFVDTKDPDLVAYYGLPTGIPYIGNMNLSFTMQGLEGGGFVSDPSGSGDIFNTPTPEPTTALLMGLGLLGIHRVIRRKRA